MFLAYVLPIKLGPPVPDMVIHGKLLLPVAHVMVPALSPLHVALVKEKAIHQMLSLELQNPQKKQG